MHGVVTLGLFIRSHDIRQTFRLATAPPEQQPSYLSDFLLLVDSAPHSPSTPLLIPLEDQAEEADIWVLSASSAEVSQPQRTSEKS